VTLTQLHKEVHGNAGHVAQGWRTDTIHRLTTQPRTHVFTFDYRGFGHSTGTPTEAGLTTDGVALVNYVVHTIGIPPERIVLMGQSLGTAVASAVGLEFLDPKNDLHPGRLGGAEEAALLANTDLVDIPTAFAGIILVAPFCNLPSLMLTYRMGGLVPLLAPLRPFPKLTTLLTSNMVDKWQTADRLRAYYDAFAQLPELLTSRNGFTMGSLQIIHGFNDMDITYRQTEMICRRVLGDKECIDESGGKAVLSEQRDGRPGVRIEIFGF
jgi:abhydrolase domain-containing protein 12